MLLRIKMILIALTLVLPLLSPAQKTKKSDKLILDNLAAHIHYLTDDKLEGRRTGTPGEKLASDYISSEFSGAGLQPKGNHNGWLQAFDIDEGRQIDTATYFYINDQPLLLNKEYFPLPYSAVGAVSGSPAIALQEGGVPWFIDLKELLETGQGEPHFKPGETLRAKIKECSKKGATAVILYNTSRIRDKLVYDPMDRSETLSIPVLYLTREAKRKYLKDEAAAVDIRLRTAFTEKRRTGHNVVGYLDNGASNTVIIGAHYDHLGYGEDGTPAYKGPRQAGATQAGPRQLFHGADNNASGVAAIIELSKLLAGSRLKDNNYLFIAFSGGELGLAGSRYFVEHPGIDLGRVNYMINLDRVGRLNDSSHALTIGGYRSSPVWADVCNNAPDQKYLVIKFDSSGNAGDHNSFYHAGIPALLFTTGWNSDDYTPADDADKINYPGELEVLKYIYNIVQGLNKQGKIPFISMP